MILLLSCRAHAGRWARIREEWLIPSGIPYVIVVGDASLGTGAHAMGDDAYSDVLTVGCDDGYDDLTSKVALAVRAIRERFDPEFLFKIDDDVTVDPHKLARHAAIPERVQYGGKVVIAHEATIPGLTKFKRSENRSASYVGATYCAGPMYLLRRRAIQVLAEHMDPKTSKYEDVAVALTLKEHGIAPESIVMYTDVLAEFQRGQCVAWHDAQHTSFLNVADVRLTDPRASAPVADGWTGMCDVLSAEACTIPARSRISVPTGWTMQAPEGARLGTQPSLTMAMAGVDLCAADLAERGVVVLHNHTDQPFQVAQGALVARACFEPTCERPTFRVA